MDGSTSFGRVLSRSHMAFFFFNLFPIFGLVPEETHGGVSNLEVGSKVLDGLKAIIVIIELLVIK